MWLTYEQMLLLLLLLVANGSPLIVRALFPCHLNWRLDGGHDFIDGHPLFGSTKMVRGVLGALTITPLASVLLGLGWQLGLLTGLFAMLGDLTSSFVKRRLGMPSSSMALGLDQVPESLFPLLAADCWSTCRYCRLRGWSGCFLSVNCCCPGCSTGCTCASIPIEGAAGAVSPRAGSSVAH